MMHTYTDLAERTHLLWLQRLALTSSDYVTLSQLKLHDNRLLQSVRLCQRYLSGSDPELPLWLNALLDNRVADLGTVLTIPLPLSAQALLAELWLALHQKTASHYVQQYQRPEQSPLLCLLVNKALAANLYQAMQALDLRSAVQLAGQFGLTEQRGLLQQFSSKPGTNSTLLAELNYSLYLLGQRTNEFDLVLSLQQAECLTPRQLQLLLLAAPAEDKVKIVNALSVIDIGLAINAMGFSGQTKFLPLLHELTTDPAYQGAAQSALITMSGNLSAETLQMRDPLTVNGVQHSSNQHLIGGMTAETLNLPALWADGNQYQRFAAAALLVLQQPGLALAEPNSWQGGLWPVA
ncbi:hypothetical protein [Arsukibacterium indicum]|uniref:Uncharacterized protein n=1 Tax=Arsukibacterium indicum TaxID=2848612 RepID=A0ABS6MLN3_9GAMM|nr:hypothetical protein [Arsukibacterium indicum]MBV2129704.1 hypothetical protein [Arsukibacterium indicum]